MAPVSRPTTAQALSIAAGGGGRFRWTCETFWAVERFLAVATADERAALADAVRTGTIGLSASYLNFSELAGEALLKAVTARASRFGAWIGAPVRCAMTADVNGFVLARRACALEPRKFQ